MTPEQVEAGMKAAEDHGFLWRVSRDGRVSYLYGTIHLARLAWVFPGPTVVEARTYRHFGHSRTDPGTYRPAEEVREWLARDPLAVARDRLSRLGVPDDVVSTVDGRVAELVAAAVSAAKAAPPADPAEALTDVWADGGAQWRT